MPSSKQTSVSGISSGAYMAGQFQVAHSDEVVGAGIVAGGPYGCAESLYADVIPGPGTALLNLTKAINGCMLNALQAFGVPNPKQLAERAGRLAERGRIDPVDKVKGDRIYLFTGKDDHTVVPAIVDAARRFYETLGVPDAQIHYVSDLPAGHGFVTEDKGPACDYTGKPYIVDCDYDQAGAILKQIYGPLAPRADEGDRPLHPLRPEPLHRRSHQPRPQRPRHRLRAEGLQRGRPAAACTSPSTAADRTALSSARRSRAIQASPAGPTPTSSSCYSRRRRPRRSTRRAAGTGGATRAATTSRATGPQIVAVQRMLRAASGPAAPPPEKAASTRHTGATLS